MLANLYDFDPGADAAPRGEMREVDRWILDALGRLVERLTRAYEEFEFHQVYYRVHEFCAVELSQVYLDLLKDRLYTYPPKSAGRRSAQTALFVLATALAKVLTPILSHTTEEVWQHLGQWDGKEVTVQLAHWPDLGEWRGDALAGRWSDVILTYLEQADRAVEELRQRGVVKQPMEAELTLYCSEDTWQALVGALGPDDLAAGNGVSRVGYGGRIEEAPGDAYLAAGGEPVRIAGRRLDEPKCERCWRRQGSVGSDPDHPGLCARCVEYVSG
jgi:isoleucyl-tRNA synthetase